MRARYEGPRSLNIDQEDLLMAMEKMPAVLGQLADLASQDAEIQYALSHIDPFNPDVIGVRTPRIIPEKTLTTYDYQTAQISVNASGRALIILNYDAW